MKTPFSRQILLFIWAFFLCIPSIIAKSPSYEGFPLKIKFTCSIRQTRSVGRNSFSPQEFTRKEIDATMTKTLCESFAPYQIPDKRDLLHLLHAECTVHTNTNASCHFVDSTMEGPKGEQSFPPLQLRHFQSNLTELTLVKELETNIDSFLKKGRYLNIYGYTLGCPKRILITSDHTHCQPFCTPTAPCDTCIRDYDQITVNLNQTSDMFMCLLNQQVAYTTGNFTLRCRRGSGPEVQIPYEIYSNKAPVFTAALSAKSVRAGSSLSYVLPTVFTNTDQPYIITAACDAVCSSFQTVVNSTRTLTYSPPSTAVSSTYTVTVVVRDTVFSLQTQYTFTLQVIANSPPVITTFASDITIQAGKPPQHQTIVATDSDSTVLTLDVISLPLPAYISFTGFTFNFQAISTQAPETFTVRYRVFDGIDYSTSSSFIVTVKAQNLPPILVTGISDFSIAVGSPALSKSVQATDPESDPLNLVIANTPLPSYIAFDGGLTFTVSPSFAQAASTDTVIYSITDGENTIGTYQFQVTVINLAPYWIQLPDSQTIQVGHSLSYAPVFTDPEGNPATALSASSPSFVTLTSTFLIAPPYSLLPGVHTVSNIVITDEVYQSVPESFTITVINTPPVSQILKDMTISVGKTYTYLIPLAPDPEGNTVLITIDNLNLAYSTFDPALRILKFSPAFTEASDVRTLTVNYFDGALTTTNSFVLKVVNEPPYFSPKLVNQTMYATSMFKYSLPGAVDPEGGPVSIKFDDKVITDFMIWVPDSRTFIFVPSDKDAPRTVIVQFNLSDGANKVSFMWQMKILKPPKVMALKNLGPPYLNKSTGTQEREITVIAGSSMVFELPSVSDPDDDNILPPKIDIGAALVFAYLKDRTKVVFEPTNDDVGQYHMKVLLQDLNPYYVLKDKITFLVTVLPSNDTTSSSLLREWDILKILIKSKATRIRFRRSKIDYQGLMRVKFYPAFTNYEVLNQLSNMTMKLHMVEPMWNYNPSERDLRTAIKKGFATEITYEQLNVTLKEMKLQLNKTFLEGLPYHQVMPLPINTIQSWYWVFLEVNKTLNSTVMLFDSTGLDPFFKKGTEYIAINEPAFAYLPDQLTQNEQLLADKFESIIQTVAQILLPTNLLFKFFTVGAFGYLWNMLESLTRLTSLSLISVKFPAYSNIMNRFLLEFAQLDILPSDKIEEEFLDFDDFNDSSLGPSFEEQGYESLNALRNLGSSFIYLILSCFLFSLILAATLIISDQSTLIGKMLLKKKRQLFWNFFIRMIIQQYFTYTVASLINILNLKVQHSADALASAVSIILTGVIILSPPLFYALLHRSSKITRFRSRFGSLKSRVRTNIVPIDLMQSLTQILIYIFMRGQPNIQMGLIYMLFVMKESYIIVWQPYKRKRDNRLAFLNEFILSTYLLTLMFLTDADGSQSLIDGCDWALMIITGIFVALNLGMYLWESIMELIVLCKKFNKRKNMTAAQLKQHKHQLKYLKKLRKKGRNGNDFRSMKSEKPHSLKKLNQQSRNISSEQTLSQFNSSSTTFQSRNNSFINQRTDPLSSEAYQYPLENIYRQNVAAKVKPLRTFLPQIVRVQEPIVPYQLDKQKQHAKFYQGHLNNQEGTQATVQFARVIANACAQRRGSYSESV